MGFLSLVGLAKTYQTDKGTVEALGGVDLAVRRGEFVALLGPSGCGKSTLLRLVAGLEPPSRGEISLAGQPVASWGRERTLVFQDPTLWPWLSALENVALGLRLSGVPNPERRRRALTLLAGMGLADYTALYPHQLSGGMQQRVALARALAVSPEVLLLDEPFASVDIPTRKGLQDDLLGLWQERGLTVLLVTHSSWEALRLADRVVALTHRPGRVLFELPVDLPRPRRTADLEAYEERLQQMIASRPKAREGR